MELSAPSPITRGILQSGYRDGDRPGADPWGAGQYAWVRPAKPKTLRTRLGVLWLLHRQGRSRRRGHETTGRGPRARCGPEIAERARLGNLREAGQGSTPGATAAVRQRLELRNTQKRVELDGVLATGNHPSHSEAAQEQQQAAAG